MTTSLADKYSEYLDFVAQGESADPDRWRMLLGQNGDGPRPSLLERYPFTLARTAQLRDQYEAELRLSGHSVETVRQLIAKAPTIFSRVKPFSGPSSRSRKVSQEYFGIAIYPPLWHQTTQVPGRGNDELRLAPLLKDVNAAAKKAGVPEEAANQALALLVTHRYQAQGALLLNRSLDKIGTIRRQNKLVFVSYAQWSTALRADQKLHTALVYEATAEARERRKSVIGELYGEAAVTKVFQIVSALSLPPSDAPEGEVARYRTSALAPLLRGDVDGAYQLLGREVAGHPTWFSPVTRENFGVEMSARAQASKPVTPKRKTALEAERLLRSQHRHVWYDGNTLIQVSQPLITFKTPQVLVVRRGITPQAAAPWGPPMNVKRHSLKSFLELIEGMEVAYETPARSLPARNVSPYDQQSAIPWAAFSPAEQTALVGFLAEHGRIARDSNRRLLFNADWLAEQETRVAEQRADGPLARGQEAAKPPSPDVVAEARAARRNQLPQQPSQGPKKTSPEL
jgi:hypothetical protein